jgi:hypothetical protein
MSAWKMMVRVAMRMRPAALLKNKTTSCNR